LCQFLLNSSRTPTSLPPLMSLSSSGKNPTQFDVISLLNL